MKILANYFNLANNNEWSAEVTVSMLYINEINYGIRGLLEVLGNVGIIEGGLTKPYLNIGSLLYKFIYSYTTYSMHG